MVSINDISEIGISNDICFSVVLITFNILTQRYVIYLKNQNFYWCWVARWRAEKQREGGGMFGKVGKMYYFCRYICTL
jgi:hypothetical protein